MGSLESAFQQTSAAFRQYLPHLESPRFLIAKDQDASAYAKTFLETKNPPWLYGLTRAWQQLYNEPFKGITNNGTVIRDLFQTQDEGVCIEDIVKAATRMLDLLSPEQKSDLMYPINAREWRAWSNPEILLRPFGVRLEDLPEQTAASILAVIEATFSREGYRKALSAMRINHFLGELCNLSKIMNQYSYNFLLFGTPSATKPWGWLLYGHHLCLSVFLKGPQIIISPTFTGAEPNIIDDGPFKGTEILKEEGALGLKLMQSLSESQRSTAQVYRMLRDPEMRQTGDLKEDRWNQDDQRHMCGAFRDNRVVPDEGVRVCEMNEKQQQLVLDIAEEFLLYLPKQAREMRKAHIRQHFDSSLFSWIGGYGDEDAFYYRVQSPVVILEFDHHSGVFLSNKEPAKFHTHTIVRTPNAGDYGAALRGFSEKLS